MPPADLIGGPYRAPAVRPGDWLDDEIHGLVQVGGWTDAPIPWPRRKRSGRPSLILCGDLVRALHVESSEAIQHHWGVSSVTVWSWRQALGIGRVTEGTRQLLQERTGVPEDAAARGRAAAAAPQVRERMAQSKRGIPAPAATREGLLRAAKRDKPEGWGKRANAWMLDGKRGARRPEDSDIARRVESSESSLMALSDDELLRLQARVEAELHRRPVRRFPVGAMAEFESRAGRRVLIRVAQVIGDSVSGVEVDPETRKDTYRKWHVPIRRLGRPTPAQGPSPDADY